MAKLEFTASKIKLVSIDKISPNSWNPKKAGTPEYQKVKKSIQLKGLRGVVVVREMGDGYEIIDGEQRYTAAKELGFKEMYVYNEGQVSDKDAKELTIWYQQQVPFDKIDEAHLVNDLVISYPDYQLPYSDNELASLKEIAEFDWSGYGQQAGGEGDKEGFRTIHIPVTEGQYEIIMNALSKVIMETECSEATALERICADYLAGR